MSWIFGFIAFVAFGVFLAVVLKKKPFIICLINPIPAFLFIFLLVSLAPFASNLLSSSGVTANTSVGTIITFIVASLIWTNLAASITVALLGVYSWMKFGNDTLKKTLAKKQVIAGCVSLLLLAISFVAINVVIQALLLGSMGPARVPTLREVQKHKESSGY